METLGGGGGCVNGGDGGMKNKRTGKDMERRRRAEGGEAKWEGTRDGGRNRLTNTKQTARENEKSRLSFLSPIFFFFWPLWEIIQSTSPQCITLSESQDMDLPKVNTAATPSSIPFALRRRQPARSPSVLLICVALCNASGAEWWRRNV